MAVDFNHLPPRQAVPDIHPLGLLWFVIFLALVIAGIFSVLMLWPKDEPTQTTWFWICVTLYPVGIASFVVLRRYSAYEAQRLDAIAWNEAREEYLEKVFEQARRPLAILAVMTRFSSTAKDDDLEKLLGGSLKLEAQCSPVPDRPPVLANWFKKPDQDRHGNSFTEDRQRQQEVLDWIFSAVLNKAAETIRNLPAALKLKIHLILPASIRTTDAIISWRTHWLNSGLREAEVDILTGEHDLMYLDRWLDQCNRGKDEEVRLLVAIGLNSLYQSLPPEGSAEIASALLLVPETMIHQFNMIPVAMLHRPNDSQDCKVSIALERAIQWSTTAPAQIKSIWQSGVSENHGNLVGTATISMGIEARINNTDHMIGNAGSVAAWLALACAAGAAATNGGAHIAATSGKSGPCFSVVRAAAEFSSQ